MENKNVNNKESTTNLEYKILLIIFIIIGIIGIILFAVILHGRNANDPTENTEIDEDKIEILNLKDYSAVLIYNKTPYYLVDTTVVEENMILDRIGFTEHSFSETNNNLYDAYDGAVYNYDENCNIYSLKGTDDLAVYFDDGFGYALFTKDMEKAKADYSFPNRTEGTVYLYTHANLEEYIELNIDDLKDAELVEEEVDLSTNCRICLLTVNNNGYIYAYSCSYNKTTNQLFITDELNETLYKVDIVLEVESWK